MTFAGWALAEVATLFAVGALGITGLYLLRMRRRRVVVPFAALWDRVTRESDTRRLWRKLRRVLSWLLQLALLALLCVALGDPRPDVWLRDPVTLALVIDRSASMAGPAADADGDARTRLDAAVERARAELNALGPADRALVITAGAEVRVPGPLSGDPGQLLRSLDDLTVQPGESDLARAIALAQNAVRGQEGARVLVLTDGALDVPGASALRGCVGDALPCKLAIFSGPNANLALTAFAARRYPEDREHVEVLAEVQNLGDAPATAVLEVEADGVSVGRRSVELAAGESRREIIPKVEAARTRLRARLLPAGELAEGDITRGGLGPADDDLAHAIVPPLRPIKVALVNDGTNLFLEAALLTLEDHIELRGVPVADMIAGAPAIDEADLVIFDIADNPLPDPLPARNLVLFDPARREGSPSPIKKRADIPRPFLTEQLSEHPLLEHVVLKDINIARGTSFELEAGDEALVRSLGEPVVVLRSGLRSVLAIGFDPRQSDLPLRVAFPVLVHNIIEYFERAMPGFVASVPVGARRPLALAELGLNPEGLGAVAITGPERDEDAAEEPTEDEDGAGAETELRAPVQDGIFRMRAMEPGVYRIRAVDGPNAGAEVLVAVNQASVLASDLHNRVAALGLPEDTGAPAPPEPAPVGDGPLWSLLLLAAAALIALEWATYHRRVTV
ncbi:MAG: VWA domain-containing protein [Myxococcales bacterium]|nr:VWA domain-containing protein [Myxococcales bacterium]